MAVATERMISVLRLGMRCDGRGIHDNLLPPEVKAALRIQRRWRMIIEKDAPKATTDPGPGPGPWTLDPALVSSLTRTSLKSYPYVWLPAYA